MARPKKNIDFSLPRAEQGHNSDERLRDFVGNYARLQNEIVALRDEQKLILTEAKDEGHSKMAIRKAVKLLMMTDEQRQAAREVQEQVERITAECADLPLFGGLEEAA